MKVVAVAGGTGSVGSTIVDGLVEYGKHKVYALSRKVSQSSAFDLLGGLMLTSNRNDRHKAL